MPFYDVCLVFSDEAHARSVRLPPLPPVAGEPRLWQCVWTVPLADVDEDEPSADLRRRLAEALLERASRERGFVAGWAEGRSSKAASFLPRDPVELAVECLQQRNWVGLANLLSGDLLAWAVRLSRSVSEAPARDHPVRPKAPEDLQRFLSLAGGALKGRLPGLDVEAALVDETLYSWRGKPPVRLPEALQACGLEPLDDEGLRWARDDNDPWR